MTTLTTTTTAEVKTAMQLGWGDADAGRDKRTVHEVKDATGANTGMDVWPAYTMGYGERVARPPVE